MDLPEDASDYDAGVVRSALSGDEQQWFKRQRRHLELADGDVQGEPPDAEDLVSAHDVPVLPERWSQFQEWLPPIAVTGSPALLSRGDLTDIAAGCRQTGDWLPLLVASFMWGWGMRGFGPIRLSWVLNHHREELASAPLEEIRRRLAAAVGVLDHEGGAKAYELLLGGGRIPALGPAFFTKFLYFAGRPVEVRCAATVLDKRLASRMRWFWTRRRNQPYAVDASSPAWLWQGPRWSGYRYRVYLAFLSAAAVQLSQSGQRWTPELVEMVLFRCNPAKEFGEA